MGSLSPDARIAATAAKQLGLIKREQALGLGASPRVIDRRCAKRLWIRIHRGVYRIAGTPRTYHQSLLAACMAASGEDRPAFASHHSAGVLWLFPDFVPGPIEITIPRGASFRASGVEVHLSRNCESQQWTRIGPIPVTTPARTLIDIAAISSKDRLESALDFALRKELVWLSGMQRLLEDPVPLAGTAALRKFVAERQPGIILWSDLETKFFRFCARNRLPKPVSQFQVTLPGGSPAFIDFAYPELMIAIETDGYESHSGKIKWMSDMARANDLIAIGWTVLRFSWDDVVRRPREVARQIRAVLGRASLSQRAVGRA